MNRVSVEAKKLDYFMYPISGVITTNSQLVLVTSFKEYRAIRPKFEQLDLLSKQVRNTTLNNSYF